MNHEIKDPTLIKAILHEIEAQRERVAAFPATGVTVSVKESYLRHLNGQIEIARKALREAEEKNEVCV